MLSSKSESDITSLAPSSPSRSPKRPLYYVQSPSRDSHDGDKSSSMQPSPMESPSHPSFGRHSRNSSSSRFSGIFRSFSGRKGSRKRNDKGWPECNVIMEEGEYDEDKAFTRRFQALIALCSFIVLFTVFCLIIWGASRPFKAEIPLLWCSNEDAYSEWLIENEHTQSCNIFGIHVSSTPINLIYSEIPVATGQQAMPILILQLKKYYQPRKSRRTVSVIVEGDKIPLYGAGSSLTVSQPGIVVPLTLKFEIRSRGNVVGKLVRTKHKKLISCPVVLDSTSSKPIKFKKGTCTYD
ncbi:hypothetical protein GH714_035333 [Hevea brasiliensis]|uniref:Late embryogenesis abundant protein LEA-2 subgroup domain-containing protein n=1 Tax=Hevea brasiliensis TaxID=3981 RepID=A0A6A6NEE5_HEVBR|nr:hypothetical protein GH714_035333 [Hevea brasiliensis]